MCERVQKSTDDQESEARPSDNVLYLRSTISGNQWKKRQKERICLSLYGFTERHLTDVFGKFKWDNSQNYKYFSNIKNKL